MKVQCPAKVNLFLEVTGRRKDGYHALATLFAKVNLFDTVGVESAPPGVVELAIDNRTGSPLSEGPDNLVVRAARAYLREFRLEAGARLTLEKKIPMGAGLGGGSSDAAGTLTALSRLYRKGLGPSERARLKKVASSLGADVPFFLRPEPFCLGKGVGDRLSPVTVREAMPPMVLVYPGVPIATAGVYRALKRPSRSVVLTRLSQLDTLLKKLRNARPISEWAPLLFNRLEDAVLPAHGEVLQARDILGRLGAQGVLMSGSGSSVFGFVRGQAEAESIERMLRGYPWQVFPTCCMG